MFSRTLQRFLTTFLAPLLGLLLFAPGGEALARTKSYLFCFWNVENFFDDRDDHRKGFGDKDYDSWFANNPDILKLKLSNLSKALVQMNDGKGPDIIALVEVESVRAAELLRQALNARLEDESLHYKTILMKELKNAGRHIFPAIITRLPPIKDKTRMLGKRMRILEGHLVVDGQELIVMVAHCTSRIRGGAAQRAKYGDQMYGRFKGMYKSNPRVDLLICGDFNAGPNSDSIKDHLRATGDKRAVLEGGDDPLLFNLFADKDPKEGFGTHYDRGRWWLFDQIIVSSGMLDNSGWSCDPDSARVEKYTALKTGRVKGRPHHFGGKREKAKRGYSDHFPVTIRLTVRGH
jgi:endonuclease/exonuclease/phosphatase family metal-dependent hydrolase